jgi:hypothetical protein
MKLLDLPSSVIERDDPSGIKASRAIVASDCVAGASSVETEPPCTGAQIKSSTTTFSWTAYFAPRKIEISLQTISLIDSLAKLVREGNSIEKVSISAFS